MKNEKILKLSAINGKIYGMSFAKPDSLRNAPRPVDGAELETLAQKTAWTALKIIENKSGIARAELKKHIDDAAQAAALAYLEHAAENASGTAPIREMCRAACKVINDAVFCGGKNSGNFDAEQASRARQAAGNTDALQHVVAEERRVAILSRINERTRETCRHIIDGRRAGYTDAEIIAALNISRRTFYRYMDTIRAAARDTE